MKLLRMILLLSLPAMLAVPATAQRAVLYPTETGNNYAPGNAQLFLNTSGLSLPASAANPFPIVTSPGGGSQVLLVQSGNQQVRYPTATGNNYAPGYVEMFLDPSGLAVPASAANPLPVTYVGGGTVSFSSISLNPGVGVTTPAITTIQSPPTTGAFGMAGTRPSWNRFTITQDAVDSSAFNDLDGWGFYYTYGGSNMKGARQTFDVESTFNGPSNSGNTNRFYVAGVFNQVVNGGDGGTDTAGGAQGAVFGLSAGVGIHSTATNLASVAGVEFDISLLGTSRTRYGVSVVDFASTSGAPIATNDAGYVIGKTTTAVGWSNGFLFSNLNGSPPLTTSGCAICTDGSSSTIATGLDLSSYTVSGNFLNSKTFTVTGAGNVTGLAYDFTGTTSATPTNGLFLPSNNVVGVAANGTTILYAASNNIGVGGNGQIRTSDMFSMHGSGNGPVGMTIRNSTVAGAANQTVAIFDNDTNIAEILFNGHSFSGGYGPDALQIAGVAASPIVIGTGSETITFGASGAVTANNSPWTFAGINATSVGAGTPGTGAFTTISATGAVTGIAYDFSGTSSTPTNGVFSPSSNIVGIAANGTAIVYAANNNVGIGGSGQINTSDMFSLHGSGNGPVGMTIRNSTTAGAANQTVLIFDNNTANAEIIFNGSSFSGGFGADAFQIAGIAGSPIVIGTSSETIIFGSTGAVTANNSTWNHAAVNATSVGATTPGTGAFTTLSASSTVSGNGFSTYLASPPAIGGTAAAAGSFTTLSATGAITSTVSTGAAPLVVSSTTNVANLNASSLNGATFAAPGAIGGTTASTGAFTTLSASTAGTVSAPTITFGNCGTGCGIFAPAGNEIEFTVNGANALDFGVSTASIWTNPHSFSGPSGSYKLNAAGSSATTPTLLPNTGSSNTGIGGTSGNLAFIVGGANEMDYGITNSGAWSINGIAVGGAADYVCISGASGGKLSTETTATTCTTSAARFKQDIVDITPDEALRVVLGLAPRSYHYRPETNMGDDLHYGFIADEAMNVKRDLVTFEDDGQTHGFKYGEMAPFLVGAIHALETEITTLRGEVDALRSGR